MERSTIKTQLNSLTPAPAKTSQLTRIVQLTQTAQLAQTEAAEMENMEVCTCDEQVEDSLFYKVVRRLTVACAAVIVVTGVLGAVTAYSDAISIDREHRDGQ